MRRWLFALSVLVAFSLSVHAQQTVFVPVCAGTNDTAKFTAFITLIGANTGTIRLPYKNGTRCAVNNLTIPANITLDNSDGTGLKVNSGQLLTVLGPVVSPIGRQVFFGPGSTSFSGNTFVGSNGQSRISDGAGGESWATITGGGGGGGAVDSVFGRTGTVIAATGDYTWAQINKSNSSIADITFRSADDLSNGTTGTGPIVLRDSPVLITPTLGAATATSINGLGFASTTGASLSIANAKTLTVSNTLTLAGADGSTLTIPATGTAVLTSRTITEGAGLAGNTYDLSADRTLQLGTPSSLSVSSLTSVSGTTHSHAIASSSDPGATSTILATNSSGHLKLVRLGIGIAPSQPLEVNGNVLISAATANLFLKDTSTGWQSASSTVITPQNNNAIRSTTFTSGLVGWNISAAGDAEFNNVDVRGAIHASIFTYNAINATAGTLGVFKSAAKLRTDVSIPSSPTYGTTTVTVDVVDAEGLAHGSSQLFVVNDILRLKDGLVGDTWLKVTAASDQTTFWRYTAAIMAGTNTVTYRAGMGVPDYGPTGQGFIIQTADQTNSPYLQMATHTAAFSSSDSNGTLTLTPRLRLGNLNGSYGYATNIYGFGTGQYGTAGQSWLTVDPTNGVRIGNNTTVLTQVDAAGNASFTGSITAASGVIAGWTINSTSISTGTTYIASSFNIPTGASAWFGKSATGYHGWHLRDASNRAITALAGNGSIYPYLAVDDGTRARIVIGGLNNAWGSDGSTDSMGMKIWGAGGSKLVEFSDVTNNIAGWQISNDSFTAGSGSSTVGLATTITGGDDVRIYAGNSTPGSAPFRVTESGALVATNATITGAITATSGTFAGSLSAATGSFSGSVTCASCTAGSGAVTLDANGITITSGSAFANRIKWGGTDFDAPATIWGTNTTNNATVSAGSRLQSAGSATFGQAFLEAMSNDGLSRGLMYFRVHGSTHANANKAYGIISTPGMGLTVSNDTSPDLTTYAPAASTALEVRSTTGAVLFPRMTTTQRDALTATNGQVIYNSTTNKLQVRAAGAWVDLH